MATSSSVTANRRATHNKRLPLTKLSLDPKNPRLVVPPGAPEKVLLEKLYEEEALDELVPSFVENGYFDEEPLVVVPEGDGYIVVEGNRRLATLKLLLDPKLRRSIKVSGWPTLTKVQETRLREVPCVVYEKREHVLPFLGFRHITGAKKWAPFQKARFVAQLLESGESLDRIQEIIGDTASATKKLYQEFVVFNQLTKDLDFPENVIRERFSLLEVVLGQRPIKAYLGMPARLPSSHVDYIVPESKLNELQEVTTWVFGDGDVRPVINDSREISRLLAPVIEDGASLEYLQRTGDLEGAYERSGGEQEFLLKKLVKVERTLQEIAGVLPLHLEDEDVAASVRRLQKLVDSLTKQLQ